VLQAAQAAGCSAAHVPATACKRLPATGLGVQPTLRFPALVTAASPPPRLQPLQKFSAVQSAAAAQKSLHGRWFAARQIAADFQVRATLHYSIREGGCKLVVRTFAGQSAMLSTAGCTCVINISVHQACCNPCSSPLCPPVAVWAHLQPALWPLSHHPRPGLGGPAWWPWRLSEQRRPQPHTLMAAQRSAAVRPLTVS